MLQEKKKAKRTRRNVKLPVAYGVVVLDVLKWAIKQSAIKDQPSGKKDGDAPLIDVKIFTGLSIKSLEKQLEGVNDE